MSGSVRRPGVREGYDLWAPTYDATLNPLVALDRRSTFGVLSPTPGELILDAGCGTGHHLANILRSGARCIGVDISRGMLLRSRIATPDALLVQSDIGISFPFRSGSFHAVLSALVSEHIRDLSAFCAEVARVLHPGGRFVWSVFHPHLAHSGTEANFTDGDGREVRLGAEQHTLVDYRSSIENAGLSVDHTVEIVGDEQLAHLIPRATKYIGRPMLMIYRGLKP